MKNQENKSHHKPEAQKRNEQSSQHRGQQNAQGDEQERSKPNENSSGSERAEIIDESVRAGGTEKTQGALNNQDQVIRKPKGEDATLHEEAEENLEDFSLRKSDQKTQNDRTKE